MAYGNFFKELKEIKQVKNPLTSTYTVYLIGSKITTLTCSAIESGRPNFDLPDTFKVFFFHFRFFILIQSYYFRPQFQIFCL